MDGIHDLGGKAGFSDIGFRPGEPYEAFHERWEAVVFTIVMTSPRFGAYRSVDEFRHGVERIDPQAYLSHGYYGRWLGGIETLLTEKGLLAPGEVDRAVQEVSGQVQPPAAARPGSEAQIAMPDYQPGAAPLFQTGDRVKTTRLSTEGHTRLPAYGRGKTGKITAVHGLWPLPDFTAHFAGGRQAWLYTVSFAASALYLEGDDDVVIHLDLFESYLEPCQPPTVVMDSCGAASE